MRFLIQSKEGKLACVAERLEKEGHGVEFSVTNGVGVGMLKGLTNERVFSSSVDALVYEDNLLGSGEWASNVLKNSTYARALLISKGIKVLEKIQFRSADEGIAYIRECQKPLSLLSSDCSYEYSPSSRTTLIEA
ncbi:MAG: hypothetical protein ACXABY_26425, partial [Candidatus Thorarchaeota archaeon]